MRRDNDLSACYLHTLHSVIYSVESNYELYAL
jgi:hypothetical protein